MRFRYVSEAVGRDLDRPRPLLRVLVSGRHGRAHTLMLVDSGADETLLPLDLAQGLGLPLTDEECALASVAGVLDPPGKVGVAQFQFGGGRFTFQSRIVVHPSVRVPLFGHSDFFQRYRVAFDGPNGFFFVEEATPKH